MNQPDSRLSAALRRLASIAPRGAPLALGDLLKDEFRRHHFRRRRNRNARILVAAACVAASVGTFLSLRPRPSNMAAIDPSFNGFVVPPNNTALATNAMAMTGSGQAHDNTQPTQAIVWCIAISGIFPSFS